MICKYCKQEIDEANINYLRIGNSSYSYYHKDCYKSYLELKGNDNAQELCDEAFDNSFDMIKRNIDNKLLQKYLAEKYSKKITKLEVIKLATSGIEPSELLDMWIKLESQMAKAGKNNLHYDLVICQSWYEKYKQSKAKKEVYNDNLKRFKKTLQIKEDRKEFDIVDILEDFNE